MEPDFLEQLMRYVGFSERHAEVLALLGPRLEPAFPAIVDRFYQAILATPRAVAVFVDGPAQIERQKTLLTAWLFGVLSGKYDAAYLDLRARIGRTHVRIKLDQRYAIGGMNLVREGLHRALAELEPPLAERALAHAAIDKICDLELAIMVQTYAEDYSARLRDSERLATLGQLAGFVGHELRNPLAVMETSLHLLRKRLPAADEALMRHAGKLGQQLRVCSEIISSLLDLARDRPLERGEVELEPLLRSASEAIALAPGVVLTHHIAASLPPVRVDEKAIRQLLVNLISNANDALSELEEPRRSIEVHAARDRDALLLAVDDSGTGVAESLRSRLFEPLATTRSKGLGLGLALCRRIAEKHGGDIRALRSPLGGARFEVRLHDCFGVAP